MRRRVAGSSPVSIEDAPLSELTLALPPLGASAAAVARLARAVGQLLHAHLPYCALGGDAGAVASHASLMLASSAGMPCHPALAARCRPASTLQTSPRALPLPKVI